jgi:hypothetical protein
MHAYRGAHHFSIYLLQEISMARRLSLAFLSAMLVYGLSVVFAPPALAVNCDLNTCISICQKNNPQGGAGRACTSGCALTIEERKKKGQCK